MDQYITGSTIRRLREGLHMTQSQLANLLMVSDKAVSRWETGKGYPDITLLQPIAEALHVSVAELLSGHDIVNRNVSCNMLRSVLYVCPVCGNIIHGSGQSAVSCCGIALQPLEADEPDDAHRIRMESVEDETYLTIDHPMTKDHYISFIAWVTWDQFQLIKLYPQGNAEARIRLRGSGKLYACCNRHGLTVQKR